MNVFNQIYTCIALLLLLRWYYGKKVNSKWIPFHYTVTSVYFIWPHCGCHIQENPACEASSPQRTEQLTLLDSSASSSFIELDGEGVADLLAGGEGEVCGKLVPPKFRPSCALSCDWLMVVSWEGARIPEWAASVIWTIDLIISEWSWRYWATCVWLWSWKRWEHYLISSSDHATSSGEVILRTDTINLQFIAFLFSELKAFLIK